MLSPQSQPQHALAWENGGLILMARVVGWAGAAIVQADITSIQCTVTDTSEDGDGETYDAALTVSGVVFDTLQTPDVWTADATGYNFRHTLPASALPSGGRVVRVEYRFVPAAGEAFYAVFDLQVQEIYGQ